jgi:hypothetical protein
VSPIVVPFPPAPDEVIGAARRVGIVARGEVEPNVTKAEGTDPELPWEPGTCQAHLRHSTWDWCEQVARWLNHEYAWLPTHVVPPCWPLHPSIARELAALSFLHWQAAATADPQLMDEWNRNVLPLFFNRMFHALGRSGCRDGEHVDWPAEGRYVAYLSDAATAARKAAFVADTH